MVVVSNQLLVEELCKLRHQCACQYGRILRTRLFSLTVCNPIASGGSNVCVSGAKRGQSMRSWQFGMVTEPLHHFDRRETSVTLASYDLAFWYALRRWSREEPEESARLYGVTQTAHRTIFGSTMEYSVWQKRSRMLWYCGRWRMVRVVEMAASEIACQDRSWS